MARHGHHDALWAKLHELELQLAAYKLLRAGAARGEEPPAGALGLGPEEGGGPPARRGRQYDAYMRRRDARRVMAAAAASAEHQAQAKAQQARPTRAAVGAGKPMSPRALRCAARDAHEAARRVPAVPVPSTPRRDGGALPRSRTVSAPGGGSPARPQQHQRRNSLGALAELGECATPRPFLRRGTGTGGAAAPARLRAPRAHDVPAPADAAGGGTPRVPPPSPPLELSQAAHAHVRAARHARSVSELPFEAAALGLASPQARARKRWGSPERPAAMFSAGGDSHRDLSKGLKKLLSFVRKGGSGRSAGGAGDHLQQPIPAPSPRGGGGKPVSRKAWSACSLVDAPFDRAASLEGHRFPMTRAVGISG